MFPFDRNVGNGNGPNLQKIEVLNTGLVFFLSFLSDFPKKDGNRYSSPKFIKINQISEKRWSVSDVSFNGNSIFRAVRPTVQVLIPVQMFSEVNLQELVAVHSLDLSMVH